LKREKEARERENALVRFGNIVEVGSVPRRHGTVPNRNPERGGSYTTPGSVTRGKRKEEF